MLILDDGGGLFVPCGSFAHVDEGDDPGHDELGQREDVGDVYFAQDLCLHQVRKPAHQHGQSQVVSHEKHRRADDKARFATQQAAEFGFGFECVPVHGGFLFRHEREG